MSQFKGVYKRMNLKHYELLAELFKYPDEFFLERILQILSFLDKKYPSALQEAQLFFNTLSFNDLACAQELYTRSFDVQAVTTLDIGYVLYGDDYKRGEILANLNREHQKAQNDCGSDLADHLPNLLRLIFKSEDSQFIDDLVHEILAPALSKMIYEFDPQRMEEKNKLYKKHYKTLIETPNNNSMTYQYALKALFIVLKEDFKIQEEALNEYVKNDFLASLNNEMSIEKLAKG